MLLEEGPDVEIIKKYQGYLLIDTVYEDSEGWDHHDYYIGCYSQGPNKNRGYVRTKWKIGSTFTKDIIAIFKDEVEKRILF